MNSHDILVIGAGGLAKQCLGLIQSKYKSPAFFDEFKELNQNYFYDFPLYHSEEMMRVSEKFIVLISDPKKRKILVDRFKCYGKYIDSLVSPDFTNNVKKPFQWTGTILSECIAEQNVKLGNYCLINTRCSIHHDSELKEYVTLSPNVIILGNCEIENFTFIGAGAIIKEKTKIGKNCIIGMGSIVINDIPDNEVWAGNPAKFIKKNK